MIKKEISIKKNKKYSFCSCGLSKKLPLCDNMHRDFNEKNKSSYKSVKIFSKENTAIKVSCSNWDNSINE